jgi:glycosyltransferase involved in cell wall biosynthesis
VCLKSAIDNQKNKNQIVVVVDGYFEESQEVLKKYTDYIEVLDLLDNHGMQSALNYGVMNAIHEVICIINDDNVLCTDWDVELLKVFVEGTVTTINQIEPTGPGIFNFTVKDFGKTPKEFQYEEFIKYEISIRNNNITPNAGIFPFLISKKDYMIVGGFDTFYQSPFICDWDFFLKLELNNIRFQRIYSINFYHFGSIATKNGTEAEKFKRTESIAAEAFRYKWGMDPMLLDNNSHRPRGNFIKGIKF